MGSIPIARSLMTQVRPGHIGYRSFRTDRLHFWAKRVFERLQSFFLQIDVAKIVIHRADQPNTFFDFFEADSLTSEDRAEIDFFAVKTDTSAASDVDGFVVDKDSPVPVGRDRDGWREYKLPRGTSCPELGVVARC